VSWSNKLGGIWLLSVAAADLGKLILGPGGQLVVGSSPGVLGSVMLLDKGVHVCKDVLSEFVFLNAIP